MIERVESQAATGVVEEHINQKTETAFSLIKILHHFQQNQIEQKSHHRLKMKRPKWSNTNRFPIPHQQQPVIVAFQVQLESSFYCEQN